MGHTSDAVFLESFDSPSLLNTLPRMLGKTRARPLVRLRASSRICTAVAERGTRWGLPVFVRAAGIVQVSPSISWPSGATCLSRAGGGERQESKGGLVAQ